MEFLQTCSSSAITATLKGINQNAVDNVCIELWEIIEKRVCYVSPFNEVMLCEKS